MFHVQFTYFHEFTYTYLINVKAVQGHYESSVCCGYHKSTNDNNIAAVFGMNASS